jgi:hypothetical protein
MKWLLIAIIVFTQQTAKAPHYKRPTEVNHTESPRNAKGAQQNRHQAAQPMPAAPQPSLTSGGQRDAAATNNQQETKQTSDEDHSTQRKLTWFTGVLAAVGALQLVVMFLTWIVYRRQAREMRRQRHEMRQQRHVMHLQWGAMKGQLAHMGTQVSEMQKQTHHLEDSVAAAKVSADVAARVSIPTLAIENFESGDMGSADLEATLQFPKVRVAIKNHGQTPAFLRSWTIVFTCEELPDAPDYSIGKSCGIVLEKEVVEPGGSYTLPELDFRHRPEISLDDVRAIIDLKKVLWAYGSIAYYDLFGNPPWRFKFCQFALNVWAGGIEWVGGFAPHAYVGIEPFFLRTSDTGEDPKTKAEPENPN